MIKTVQYRHIIWDWNGTLLDDAWLCVDVMNGMLRERNLPERTIDQYREIFDFPVMDYYLKLGFDFGKEPFEEVGLEFIVRYNKRQKETTLHPEVMQVLEHFMTSRDTGSSSFRPGNRRNCCRRSPILDVARYFDKDLRSRRPLCPWQNRRGDPSPERDRH